MEIRMDENEKMVFVIDGERYEVDARDLREFLKKKARIRWKRVAVYLLPLIPLGLIAGLLASQGTFMFLWGFSMYPTIAPGAIAYCQQGNITKGDIVVFEYQGRKIAHRVIDIQGNMITTRGDANPEWMTETISRDQVLCKVKFFINLVPIKLFVGRR